jgi:hypothetical protein
MDPQITQAAFRIGVFIVLLALVTLPFQAAGSAAFYVTILAALVGAIFIGLVLALIKFSTRDLSARRDGQQADGSRITAANRRKE